MVAEETLLTAPEVNRRLPLVRSIVGDIVGLHADLVFRRQRLTQLRGRHPASRKNDSVYEQEVLQMESELAEDEARLQSYSSELLQIGGILTDAAAGRVDFPGELAGERGYYCWFPGDTEIHSWHSGDCGESERVSVFDVAGTMTVTEGE